MNVASVAAIFAYNSRNFNSCLDVGISTHQERKAAIDREERSSQQFRINNIGRRPAIRAENRDIIHMRSS
jgi:hypothetical protein